LAAGQGRTAIEDSGDAGVSTASTIRAAALDGLILLPRTISDVDSNTVNKLIRSEVWPLLRAQGFSKFESRTAFRYEGPFINVVSFRSFSAHLADGLKCTTFSFVLELGVYVIGSDQEEFRKKDPHGRLLPRQGDCSFRAGLNKRTAVDGFARGDIFYIDPEGHSVGPCFREVQYLVTEIARRWFSVLNDLDGLLAWMDRADKTPSELPCDIVDNFLPTPQSYVWHDLFATLQFAKHRRSPSPHSVQKALREIELAIGALLNFSQSLTPPTYREREVQRIRSLWEMLGSFAPCPPSFNSSPPPRSSLVGLSPAPFVASNDSPAGPDVPVFSARKHLWPVLRRDGFADFTDRLAHRVTADLIEVVEVLPIDPRESKRWGLPGGLFRIQVGIFWPVLGEEGLFRTNRAGNPRPKASQCHLTNFLLPEQSDTTARYAFDSAEGAAKSLATVGVPWLKSLANPESLLSILERPDWEIFWWFPMMRGFGARGSTERLVLGAGLAFHLRRPEEAKHYVYAAEAANKDVHPEGRRERYRKWIRQVKRRLLGE
jgi:hypothetical protein